MDRFVGPFTMTQHIGETTYRLDLFSYVVLRAVHNVFHVFLLHNWQDNGVHVDVPPIEIDGEAEYKVLGIKGHREGNGDV